MPVSEKQFLSLMDEMNKSHRGNYTATKISELFRVVQDMDSKGFERFIKKALWFQRPPALEDFVRERERQDSVRRSFEDTKRFQCEICDDSGLMLTFNRAGEPWAFACKCSKGNDAMSKSRVRRFCQADLAKGFTPVYKPRPEKKVFSDEDIAANFQFLREALDGQRTREEVEAYIEILENMLGGEASNNHNCHEIKTGVQ